MNISGASPVAIPSPTLGTRRDVGGKGQASMTWDQEPT